MRRANNTCPSLYDDYITRANRESGGKLAHVAQLMKFWRECRAPRIPLSSFHIEMVLASEQVCKETKPYSQCDAVKTHKQRQRVLTSITHSRNHAVSARPPEFFQIFRKPEISGTSCFATGSRGDDAFCCSVALLPSASNQQRPQNLNKYEDAPSCTARRSLNAAKSSVTIKKALRMETLRDAFFCASLPRAFCITF